MNNINKKEFKTGRLASVRRKCIVRSGAEQDEYKIYDRTVVGSQFATSHKRFERKGKPDCP